MTADLTISNYGQHPADGAHHWKYSQYQKSIDSYIMKLKKKNARKKFLWMESVAAMYRKDNWVRGYKDWRTNGRLGEYNRYATSKMRENGTFDTGLVPGRLLRNTVLQTNGANVFSSFSFHSPPPLLPLLGRLWCIKYFSSINVNDKIKPRYGTSRLWHITEINNTTNIKLFMSRSRVETVNGTINIIQ